MNEAAAPCNATNKKERLVKKRAYDYNEGSDGTEDDASMTATGSNAKDILYKQATQVVKHAASPEDVLEIERMLQRGYGVVDHVDCKFELLNSRLGPTAGRGLFVKEGFVISHGQCITEYTGEHISATNVTKYDINVQLYNMSVDGVCINGHMQPIDGQGFGSFVNSAVPGGYPSVVRLTVYKDRIFSCAMLMSATLFEAALRFTSRLGCAGGTCIMTIAGRNPAII